MTPPELCRDGNVVQQEAGSRLRRLPAAMATEACRSPSGEQTPDLWMEAGGVGFMQNAG